MAREPIAVAVHRIAAGELLQHVSRGIYRNEPLYFGRSRANRYDSPDGDYGVLYLGRDLATAIMESMFHKHMWDQDPSRSVALEEVRSRLVRMIGVMRPLILADLTAPSVMAAQFGLNLEQLVSRDYSVTQQISRRIFQAKDEQGLPRFHGILYPSRNNYPGVSIALFDRAASNVRLMQDIDLVKHASWPSFVQDYRIGIEVDSETSD